MSGSRVLVVGAGIAGATAAHRLAHAGFEVTLVERATDQRSSGSPVDVRGPAGAVVEGMGVLPQLRDVATRASALAFVDGRGRSFARLPTQVGAGVALEVPRAALAAVLVGAARRSVELRWGDTVTSLDDDGDGVDVAFEHGPGRRFDLVVGADGLHSRVRRLAFGPEERFVHPLGLFVATVALDGPAEDESTVLIHNAPGRSVTVHPATGPALAAFIFRSRHIRDRDEHGAVRDRARQEEVIAAAYEGVGWRAPELVARLRDADDLYFDGVSRVVMSRWSRGRVVLVGDAASCVSLLGEGSSLAIVGAATLAQALASRPEVGAALRLYETVHRRRVAPRARVAATMGHALVPATRGGLATRNAALRSWATLTDARRPWSPRGAA